MFFKLSKSVILTKNKKEKLIVACNLKGHSVSNQNTEPNIWNSSVTDFDDFWYTSSIYG